MRTSILVLVFAVVAPRIADAQTGRRLLAIQRVRAFEPATTNYLLRSETSCVANAVQTPWTKFGVQTCASDVTAAPDGSTTVDRWSPTTNTDFNYQTTTTPSGTRFTMSGWLAKPSGGSAVAAVAVRCPTIPAVCICGTSDNSPCSTSITTPSTQDCSAKATALTPSLVRVWAEATCASATTAPLGMVIFVDYNAARSVTDVWGTQLEPGLGPSTYVPTTTVAVSRSARPWR